MNSKQTTLSVEKSKTSTYNYGMKYYTSIVKLGNNLCVRGIKDGKAFKERVPYEPTIYIETPNETPFTSVYGKYLKPLSFHSMNEAADFVKEQQGSNLKLYGFPNWHQQYALEEYSHSEKCWNREDIRVFNVDIEVFSDQGFPEARAAAFPITAICVHDSKLDKFIVFGDGEWSPENSELPQDQIDKTYYIRCKNEVDLVNRFVKYWQDFPPDIITGWNVEFFDVPYIINRMTNIGLDVNRLSPWGNVSVKDLTTARGVEQIPNIAGVSVLDFMDLYKRRKVQDSYRLDNIASIELGQKKLDYSEVTGLHQLYVTNYQKYIDYNIQDVNLVKLLDEKLGLIDAQIAFGYMACLNFAEVNSTVRTWDALINKEMHSINQKPHLFHNIAEAHTGMPGGHVKEPQVGKHGWCLSFDLNSLYPHLIMQYNISPETINSEFKLWPEKSDEARLDALLNRETFNAPDGHCVSGSGYAFNNKIEGIIPRIMRRMYQERKAMKRQMLEKQKKGENASYEDLRQFVLKIGLNSGFGAFANKYYRWFDPRLGSSITLSGQLAIRTSEKAINDWMNNLLKTDKDYVIAIDTDSNYLNVQPLVDKFFSDKSKDEIVEILDKIAEEQIQKVISQGYEDLAEYTNAFENAMVMEREAIASSAVWTAKKRYAMCVWNMEGVPYKDEPKIKIMGLEAIRSSTPQSCRKALLDIIKKILMTDEQTIQKHIADFKEEFMSLPIEDISMPRTMNNVKKQTRRDETYNKGTPPHVRGAIAFNRLLDKKGLHNWERIQDGEKGKFVYLYLPNNVGTDVISFMHSIPEELDVKRYVDKNKMFEKIILDPVTNILEPIGWTAEKQGSLTDFFS